VKVDRTAQTLPLRRASGPDGARGVQEVVEPHDRPNERTSEDGDEREESPEYPGSPDDEATGEVTNEIDLLTPKKRERPSVADIYPEDEEDEISRELDLVI